MKLLQSNVLGGNKLNCFETTQVLGGLTQILIWGSETAKGPTRWIKGGPGALVSGGGGYNFKGEPQWCHVALFVRMLIFEK